MRVYTKLEKIVTMASCKTRGTQMSFRAFLVSAQELCAVLSFQIVMGCGQKSFAMTDKQVKPWKLLETLAKRWCKRLVLECLSSMQEALGSALVPHRRGCGGAPMKSKHSSGGCRQIRS